MSYFPYDLADITAGEWPLDLVAWAGAVTAFGIIWQRVLVPIRRGLWSAIIAAPKIADGVGDVVRLIEGDVLGKLEEIKVESAVHAEQSKARDGRINLHTITLEDHELRLGKVEEAIFGEPGGRARD